MKPLTPVQRFLGLPEGVDTPFDLLGVTPDQCDARSLSEALARRLDRVARHPHGAGHEAEEVRLALHAAAAQLGDPAVRMLLARQWRSPAFLPSEGSPRRNPALLAFREAALPLLLGRGGRKHRARARLIALAHAHGLEVADVRLALSSAPPDAIRQAPVEGASPRPAAEKPPSSKTIYEDIREAHHDAGRHAARTARMLATGFGMIGLALVATTALLVWLARSGEGDKSRPTGDSPLSSQSDSSPGPGDPSAADDLASGSRAHGEAQAVPPDPDELLARLRLAAPLLRSDPSEAAWRFDEAISALSRSWMLFDRQRLTAANEAVADFVSRAAFESAKRAVASVGAGAAALAEPEHPLAPEEVPEAVWSIGALRRLSRPAEGPPDTARDITTRLGSLVAGDAAPDSFTFRAGAVAALGSLADRLPLTAESTRSRDQALALWSAWRDAAQAVERISTAPGSPRDPAGSADTLFLAAVDRVLRRGPAPSADPVSRDALSLLLAAMSWRSADVPSGSSRRPTLAQERLLAWLDDPSISSDNLFVVTEWLSKRSDAPGVGASMILAPGSDGRTRSTLRARYASAWMGAPSRGNGSPSADLPTADPAWLRAASEMLARPPAASLMVALESAVSFARLNESAARQWRGDASGAALDALDRKVPGARPTETPPAGSVSGDGTWALAFLTAPPTLSGRLGAIAALEKRQTPLGPVDADVLGEAALLGSQQEVVDRARAIILARRAELAVLSGVLEALPSATNRPGLIAFVEQAAGGIDLFPDDPSWMASVRRALVGRLFELLAARGDRSAADRIATDFAESCAGQMDPPASSEAAAADSDTAIRALWQQRRREVERSPLDGVVESTAGINRRLLGRLRLATGPVDRYAATQTALVEATAILVTGDRPDRRVEVDRILASAAERRRRAADIGRQIEANERALTMLWVIRFGERPQAESEAKR